MRVKQCKRKCLPSFALLYTHSGTALHIAEEGVNPLSVGLKDWRLVLVK